MRKTVFGEVKVRVDIGIKRVLPLVLVQLIDISNHVLESSVVHQNVDAALE